RTDRISFPTRRSSDLNLELRSEYGGYVWAVHEFKLWGVGRTHAKALADALAKPGCPPEEDLVLVVTSGLSPDEKARQVFFRRARSEEHTSEPQSLRHL